LRALLYCRGFGRRFRVWNCTNAKRVYSVLGARVYYLYIEREIIVIALTGNIKERDTQVISIFFKKNDFHLIICYIIKERIFLKERDTQVISIFFKKKEEV
jgi:hypothetical protein